MFMLCSCSAKRSANNDISAYLGDYSYVSPISAMVYEDMDGEGKGIQYREVTDYDKLIAYSKTPVCLYFFSSQDADTSGVTAAIEQLAETYNGRILFVSIDADQETDIASHFQIDALPDFVLLDNGSLKASFAGNNGKSWTVNDLEKWIISQSGIA
jgi:thioredoxin-like negative regulator of GroEL